MKAVAALMVIASVAAAQDPGPARPPVVVVIPAAVRDSMSAVWTANNRHWDEAPESNTLSPAPPGVRPTELRYLGCLVGHLAGDTLWVSRLALAEGLKQRQFVVAGDCTTVPEVIGTWRTHPYRAGFKGRVVKERGLSGRELKKFTAAGEFVTIVMWDVDSIDVAAKGPDGARHPFPYLIR